MSADPMAAIRAVLLADTSVAALASTRVYPAALPSGISPLSAGGCVVLNPSGGPASPGVLGNYGASRIDTFCYAKTLGDAWKLYLAVYSALKHAPPQMAAGVLLKTVQVSSKGALGLDPETQFPVCLASFSVLASEVT